MPMILFIVILGAAAGFVATRLMRVEADVPTTVVIGIVGAVLGWVALRLIVAVTGWLLWVVSALVGAVLLIWLWQTYGPRR